MLVEGEEDNEAGRHAQSGASWELSGDQIPWPHNALESYPRGKQNSQEPEAKEQARGASQAWTQLCAQGHKEEQEVSGTLGVSLVPRRECWTAVQEPAPLPAL